MHSRDNPSSEKSSMWEVTGDQSFPASEAISLYSDLIHFCFLKGFTPAVIFFPKWSFSFSMQTYITCSSNDCLANAILYGFLSVIGPSNFTWAHGCLTSLHFLISLLHVTKFWLNGCNQKWCVWFLKHGLKKEASCLLLLFSPFCQEKCSAGAHCSTLQVRATH